jgi:hypothetical protein
VRLEAIAALLGHRSLDVTLRYAKIASRTVADEYFAVTEKVEALYGQHAQLPAGLGFSHSGGPSPAPERASPVGVTPRRCQPGSGAVR